MRFFQFCLALIFAASLAQAQDDPPVEVIPPPAEAKVDETKADEPKEDDSVEAIVKDGQTRHREKRWDRRKHRDEEVQVRGDVVVKKGQTTGNVVVVAGSVRIEGEVDGDVVAIASKAFIDGIVHGTVVVVPGPVTFGPNADIRDEAVVVGEFKRDPDAKFARGFQPVQIPEIVPIITGAKDYIFQGLFMLRPLPPSVPWVWVFHGAMLLLLIAMALLFPKPVLVGAKAISDRPVVSIFSGFLTAILFIPILVLLAVTVVGIVAIPFAIVGLFLAAFFGKAAVLEFIGQQIGRNLRVTFFESPLIALLIGAVILALLYMVPVLGFLVWGVATMLGLGAIMVATASALNNQPSIPTPVGVPPGYAAQSIAAAPTIPASESAATVTPPLPPNAVILRRVGFWKRTFAAFLDWFFLAIPIVSLLVARIHVFALVPLIFITYFVCMWTWKGTSIGKICLGLKVVRTDGTPIDFPVALVRSLAACFSLLVAGLGFFWAGWDKEKQSWHDKIAGTVVVQVPKGVSLL